MDPGSVAVAWVLNLGYGAACLADDEPGATMRVAILTGGANTRVLRPGRHDGRYPRGRRLPRTPREAGIDGADHPVASRASVRIWWPVHSREGGRRPGGIHGNISSPAATGRGGQSINSVVVSPEGDVLGHTKRHVVAFGEFLYFREQLKWLYRPHIRPYDLTPGARPLCSMWAARARADHLL